MKGAIVCAVLAAAIVGAFAASPMRLRMGDVPMFGTSPSEVIEDEYIVVFKPEAAQSDVDAHLHRMKSTLKMPEQVMETFNIGGTFRAYHAMVTTKATLTMIKADRAVKYVQGNGVVRATGTETSTSTSDVKVVKQAPACTRQVEVPWGLSRMNERSLLLDGIFTHQLDDGEGVEVYIVDTGILLDHVEFEGRAVWGIDTTTKKSPKTDKQGHGTHVAGIVAGKTFGVAKKAKLIAVRVLDDEGRGSDSTVIGGLTFVAGQRKSGPSTANLSLGGSASQALDDAMNALVQAGTFVAVAAGNDDKDACGYSPARAALPITVGSTDEEDYRSVFSNWGKCTDILAPGSMIESAWIGSKYAVNTISGTSMASPGIAGIGALIQSRKPKLTPQQVKETILRGATEGKLKDLKNSPNKLGFADCDSA